MKIKQLVLGLVLSVFLVLQGCATDGTSTFGDGKVDPVESALIQLSVGATMAANPKLIVPSFQVTNVLLALKEGSTMDIVDLANLDSILGAEVAKLDLDPLTLQSFNDLIVLVKASLMQQIDSTPMLDSDKLVVAWKVVEIVNATAKVRLDRSISQE